MQISKWFSSFQRKISISFVLLTASFVLIATVVAAAFITQTYQAQTSERLAFEQRYLCEVLQRVANSVNDCANSIIIQLNSDKRVSLKNVADSNAQEPFCTEYILGVAKNNLRLLPDIASINILLSNGYLYTAAYNQPMLAIRVEEAYYNKVFEYPATINGEFLRLSGVGTEETALFYCKQLRDISSNTSVGVVYLEVLTETLRDYCFANESSAVILTDAQDRVIASVGNIEAQDVFTAEQTSKNQLSLSGSTWMYDTGVVTQTGWKVTCLQNESVALKKILKMVLLLIGVSCAVLAAMTLLTTMIAQRVSRPIQELSAHMANNTNVLPTAISVPQQDDEIAALYASFNGMLIQNKQLFANYKEEQHQKNRTELALLQSQIKPHFLYNTLDTIYCLANLNRAEEAGNVTKALADYYRLVLNSGEEKITIERELAALQRYLVIMQVRYRDLLHYTIGCDESIKNVVVPKLLLQPLVENAICHGINPKKAPGTVNIYAAQKENRIELTVTDDGIGMTQERFEQALGGVRHKDDSESFGMHNILRRLKLFYGENSRIELRTENGHTTIAVMIYTEEARDV